MHHLPIESLEARRLLALLVPDRTWGDDGFSSRDTVAEHFYVGPSAGGAIVADTAYSTDKTGRRPVVIDRVNADGTPDAAFTAIAAHNAFAAAIDSAGRILIAQTDNAGDAATLTRYTRTGRLDKSFGNGGVVRCPITDAKHVDIVRDPKIATGADGSVYVSFNYDRDEFNHAGRVIGQVNEGQVFKFDASGAADTGFGDGGSLALAFDANGIFWMGVQSTGDLVVAGGTSVTATVKRYSAAGVVDSGYVITDDGGDIDVNFPEIALDGHDRLLIVDRVAATDAAPVLDRVLRYTAAGKRDTTFASGGVFSLTEPAGFIEYNNQNGLVVQNDDKPVAELGAKIVRLTTRGTPDATFGTAGTFAADSDTGTLVGQLADGRLVASTAFGFNESVSVLAAQTDAAVGRSGTLYLSGTDGDDTIVLSPNAADALVATVNGVTHPFKHPGHLTGVNVMLAGGDDVYRDTYHVDTAVLPTTVDGGAGNDSIVTGGAADSISGSIGDDTLIANGGRDAIDDDSGSTTVDAGTGGGTVEVGESTSATGAAGFVQTVVAHGRARDNQNIFVDSGIARVNFSGGTATVAAGECASSIMIVDASRGSTITGSTGADSITTGAGDDHIDLTIGDDTVRSGAGNDVVEEFNAGGPHADTHDFYDLGPGNDTARHAGGGCTVLGGDGDDSIVTGFGNDNIDGGNGRDTLRGGDGNDTLAGGGGRDDVFGQGGDDMISGAGAADTLVGGTGNDSLYGGIGDDLLEAGDPPAVRVEAARNLLDGGPGVDRGVLESDSDQTDGLETVLETI